MKSLAHSVMWWPGMDTDIEAHAKALGAGGLAVQAKTREWELWDGERSPPRQ